MTTFLDTSAILAILDADERNHSRAAGAWRKLLEDDEVLLTSSYVLVEAFALVQHRLGIDAVRVLQNDIVPLLQVVWIDEEIQARAIAALMAASRKRLSLVDCASFELMRQRGIRRAFTFDRDFAAAGFDRMP